MEQAIRELVQLRGGRCWSVRDSRGFAIVDMPDLIIVLPPKVIFCELKSQRRALTPGQAATLQLLGECTRVEACVVRPVPHDGEIGYDALLA